MALMCLHSESQAEVLVWPLLMRCIQVRCADAMLHDLQTLACSLVILRGILQ